MGTDGRIEKRATVKVPVHVGPVENCIVAETTMTINISRRGARILSSRRWLPGEELGLTSSSGEFQRQARVIYCYPLSDQKFCVGLEFDPSTKDWKDAIWARSVA